MRDVKDARGGKEITRRQWLTMKSISGCENAQYLFTVNRCF